MSEEFLEKCEKFYLPVSLLNDLYFCPKSFYYQIVQALQGDNYLLTRGKLEEEKRKQREILWKELGIKQIRFVKLSSERLKIIAIIDAIEEKENIYPIEYKSAKFRKDEGHDIQLCAQAMLLEEYFKTRIEKGFIYYSLSHKRREVVFDQKLRQKTIQMIKKAFDIINEEIIPEGRYDEKCEYCSLKRICMPEEVNFFKTGIPPKSVFAKKAIGKTVYIDEIGASLKKEYLRLVVEKDDKKIYEIPIEVIDTLVLVGNVHITTPLLKALLKRNVKIVFLNQYGWFEGAFIPEISKNSLLRIKQFEKYFDHNFRLYISKKFVIGKILNCRTLLMRYNRQIKSDEISKIVDNLEIYYKMALNTSSFEELLGIEGIASKEYFSVFGKLLKQDYAFNFEKRSKRPPSDPVNALLSFAYTLLLKDIFSSIMIVGLDPYIGFFHTSKYGRPSLALDLMEEFRPVIADSVVLSLINKNIIKKEDFEEKFNAFYLTEKAREKFYREYERRKREIIIHPILGYKVDYMRIFELQTRLLAKTLTGEIKEYIPFKIK